MREVVSSVVVAVPIEVAWPVLLDFDSWALDSQIYSGIKWLDGKPWELYSRARLSMLWPQRQDVLVKVIQHKAPTDLAALYHGNGLTSTKHMRLRAVDRKHTEFQIATDCFGDAIDSESSDAEIVLKHIYEITLKRFAKECLLRSDKIEVPPVESRTERKTRSA